MTTQPETSTSPSRADLVDLLARATGLDAEGIAGAGDASLADLGLDSLAAMEVQDTIRERYGVLIPDESLELSVPEIERFVLDGIAAGPAR